MTKFFIDFAGWLELKPEDATFVNIVTDETITGDQYLALPENERGEWNIDFEKAQDKMSDGNLEQFKVLIEN